MVPRERLELSRPKTSASKTDVSTNFTIWAFYLKNYELDLLSSQYFRFIYGGQRGIRTHESEASGFTVHPIWPLWNLPRNKNHEL